ncbi:hypothetical protein JVT61DRAFT_10424 [Boletus reticuloceps]|uniref:Uncharacterized protein n=1 Tax=Boletus reticuloceps TaxID=495285 RepID=A0A8I2YV33_9AGAM|nr:hypothetical protein JVT61DRAFT_10424 [Boletus reticuloceps]
MYRHLGRILKRILHGKMSFLLRSRSFPQAMQRWSILGALLIASRHAVAYDIFHDYSGSTFFDGWDFYGSFDNLTWGMSFELGTRLALTVVVIEGNVTWVTKEVGASQNLAYVNSENHAILKVDNVTNVTFGELRSSVCPTAFFSGKGKHVDEMY